MRTDGQWAGPNPCAGPASGVQGHRLYASLPQARRRVVRRFTSNSRFSAPNEAVTEEDGWPRRCGGGLHRWGGGRGVSGLPTRAPEAAGRDVHLVRLVNLCLGCVSAIVAKGCTDLLDGFFDVEIHTRVGRRILANSGLGSRRLRPLVVLVRPQPLQLPELHSATADAPINRPGTRLDNSSLRPSASDELNTLENRNHDVPRLDVARFHVLRRR